LPIYDFIAIGSGPAGQRAAVQAAKVGAKAAIVESTTRLGGVCINTGTIPSKTLREAIIDLGGFRQRDLYGVHTPPTVSPEQLFRRTRDVILAERVVIKSQLLRNGIDLIPGKGRFEGPHRISVTLGPHTRSLEAKSILISVGTIPAVPRNLIVDHRVVLTSDDILRLRVMPKRVVIAGAGVIGVEYATLFAALGVPVALCDVRKKLLDMVDAEVSSLFRTQLERVGVSFHLGEEIDRVEHEESSQHHVVMKSGLRLPTEIVLVSAGRLGNTATLGLENAQLAADERGRIKVNADYQTEVPHIYAAGDVIGSPALASTSAEQGRHAACHALGLEHDTLPATFPAGIYAIPEIAWVGKTEETLRQEDVPFVSGVAHYREIARGNILGDHTGMLKLLIHRHSRAILGVWICGAQATELVHIGQAVMGLGGTLDYLLRTVFNYPTLAECYKVAALNGMNKLGLSSVVPAKAS
jgi:NAD(P) transhydrogenase